MIEQLLLQTNGLAGALLLAGLLSAPILGAILVVGVTMAIVQAATQIQEQTLGYIPKLLATGAVLFLLGSWIAQLLGRYFLSCVQQVAQV